MNKIINFKKLTILAIGVLFLLGNFPANALASSQTYTFTFPNYNGSKKIVSWGDTYHYSIGLRSWNEVSINLPQSGTYDVSAYYETDSGTNQTHEEFKVFVDNSYLGETKDSNTANIYNNDYIGNRYFSAGNHTVRVEHRWNFADWDSPESVTPLSVTFTLKGENKPDLAITKSVDKSNAKSNDILVYTISYHNNGQTEANDVVISDSVDPNLMVVNSGGGTVFDRNITWVIGTVPAGQGGIRTFVARVKNINQNSFYVYNQASIKANGTNIKYSNKVQTVINNNYQGHPPVADAGPDRQVYPGESIPLLGSGYDPDGYAVTYSWTCSGGTLNNYHIVQPLFTAPSVNSNTYYNCTLTVTDKEGLADSDEAQILVKTRPINNVQLEIDKAVRNLSRGETSWNKSTYASSSDIVEFRIKVASQANTILKNLMVKDTLPSQLSYQGNLRLDDNVYYGNITTQTINIGDLNPGQTRIITFKAIVKGEETFPYGTTELINTIVVYNTDISKTDTCKVIINKKSVKGASTISTGITDNFFFSSLLFPLLSSVLLVWLFKSRIIGLDKAIEEKSNSILEYRSEKKLQKKINNLKNRLF